MSTYRFPGFTTFLDSAAREIGRPEASAPARRITTLSSLANLCSQVEDADPVAARTILERAAEYRDQLLAAYIAAERMLDEVSTAAGVETRPALDAEAPGARGRSVVGPRRKPRPRPGPGVV